MNRSIKKSIYSIFAAAGFVSAMLVPCYSSGGASFPASDILAGSNDSFDTVLSAKDFSDVDTGAWYYPYVELLVSEKVINGTSENTFSPDGTFTLAECSAVITRYLGLDSYAAKRKKDLVNSGIVGADLWYSGYVQTLYDTGILEPESFMLPASGGYISIGSTELCERPLKRYEFASLITRSFDIKTDKVYSGSLYPEICNNANELITGGKYDTTVENYRSEIADFELIPENSREYVLKAYYNGIFNGDAVGNFNPEDMLRRSEMAKVIAVVTNPSLRKRNEYRALPDVFVISDDKYIFDGWNEDTLDRTYGKTILETSAKGISVSEVSGMTVLTYTPSPAPEKYFIEARVYQNNEGVYKEIARSTPSMNNDLVCYGYDMRLVLTLRNAKDAKIEGVLRADVTNSQNITFTDLFKQISR